MKRVIWIVLDSVGMGEAPDAADFDDIGCNTIGHIMEKYPDLEIPNLRSIGYGNIDGMVGVKPVAEPLGTFGRMQEISAGKDTTIGHWEMVGIYTPERFPTYPDGFPKEIIDEFVDKTGVSGVLYNGVASGTVIINELGDEMKATGKPIVYTSADSVFQIACDESVYPPEKLYEMYSAVTEEGYDCCGLRRVTRKGEPPVRSFFARQYYQIFNKISDVELVDGARDFRLMTRQMLDAVLSLKEVNRYSKGIFSWVGFSVKWLEYENVERVAGETKWNFWKLLAYSVESFVDFSVAPLHFVSVMGILTTFIAVLAIIFVIVRQLVFGGSAYGWPSLVCIILLLGGLLIFSIGIVGEYLAKMYLEIKDRPVYIVKEEE